MFLTFSNSSSLFPQKLKTPQSELKFAGKRAAITKKVWPKVEALHIVAASTDEDVIASSELALTKAMQEAVSEKAIEARTNRVIKRLIKDIKGKADKYIAGGKDTIRLPEYWDNALQSISQTSLVDSSLKSVSSSEVSLVQAVPPQSSSLTLGSVNKRTKGSSSRANMSRQSLSSNDPQLIKRIKREVTSSEVSVNSSIPNLSPATVLTLSWNYPRLQNQSPLVKAFTQRLKVIQSLIVNLSSVSSKNSSRRSSDVSIDMEEAFGIDDEKLKILESAKMDQVIRFRINLLAEKQREMVQNTGRIAAFVARRLNETKETVRQKNLIQQAGWAAAVSAKLKNPQFPEFFSPSSNESSDLSSPLFVSSPSSPLEYNFEPASFQQEQGYKTPDDKTLRVRSRTFQELGEKLSKKLKSFKGQKKAQHRIIANGLTDAEKQKFLTHMADIDQELALLLQWFNEKFETTFQKKDFMQLSSYINKHTNMHIGSNRSGRYTDNNRLFIDHMKGRTTPILDLVEEWKSSHPDNPVASSIATIVVQHNKNASEKKKIGQRIAIQERAFGEAHPERERAKAFLARPEVKNMETGKKGHMANDRLGQFEAYKSEYPDTDLPLNTFGFYARGKR